LVRIDHIFVNGIFEVKSIQQPRTPTTRQASDHLPLCVELSLNRSSGS
jgi:endonuclease/exonuclease/phosphatase family metal-dependent hydrolase